MAVSYDDLVLPFRKLKLFHVVDESHYSATIGADSLGAAIDEVESVTGKKVASIERTDEVYIAPSADGVAELEEARKLIQSLHARAIPAINAFRAAHSEAYTPNLGELIEWLTVQWQMTQKT